MDLTGNIEPFHLSRLHGQEAYMLLALLIPWNWNSALKRRKPSGRIFKHLPRLPSIYFVISAVLVGQTS